MEISSVRPPTDPIPGVSPISAQELTQRRQLLKATDTINNSGVLGDANLLTFVIDRATHRAIIRVVDRTTNELVMQLPPQYVLSLADDLEQGGVHPAGV